MKNLNGAELNRMAQKHLSALNLAKRTGNPEKIISVCAAALQEFSETSYPDNWRLWERAKEDAEMDLIAG